VPSKRSACDALQPAFADTLILHHSTASRQEKFAGRPARAARRKVATSLTRAASSANAASIAQPAPIATPVRFS
jgi:hypothetical protein